MTPNGHQTYRIRVAGHLDDRWSNWFGDFTIARCDDGTCTLSGPVTDQAQLHGILARLRDIGATLLSLCAIDSDDGSGHGDSCRGALSSPAGDRASRDVCDVGRRRA